MVGNGDSKMGGCSSWFFVFRFLLSTPPIHTTTVHTNGTVHCEFRVSMLFDFLKNWSGALS